MCVRVFTYIHTDGQLSLISACHVISCCYSVVMLSFVIVRLFYELLEVIFVCETKREIVGIR